MNQIINKIVPISADNNYKGYRIAAIVFLLIAIVGTVRSCILFFSPDGGAGSIAREFKSLLLTGESNADQERIKVCVNYFMLFFIALAAVQNQFAFLW